MKAVLNCILATLSIVLVVESFVFRTDYLYLLLIIPALSLIFKRNPFNFPLFAILIGISLINVLPTQTFYGLVNVLHYLGYDVSYLLDMFHPTLNYIPLIVTLFVVSQVIWHSEHEVTIPLSFAFGFLAYAFYNYLIVPLNADRLVLGVFGVLALTVAFAGVSRWRGR
ncbi:hypothetical protein [Archaeoglobus sp.]